MLDISRAETLALIRYYASMIQAIADKGELGDIDALIDHVRRLGEIGCKARDYKKGLVKSILFL